MFDTLTLTLISMIIILMTVIIMTIVMTTFISSQSWPRIVCIVLLLMFVIISLALIAWLFARFI